MVGVNLVKLLFLLFWALPVALNAQFTFVTNNGAITITGYTGSSNAVVIPGTTNGRPVNSIANHAFFNIPTLFSVTIPASITNYANSAFVNCTNLLGVYFQGNAPIDSFPVAPPIFSGTPKATLYYLQGTLGWGSTFDSLPVVQWNPQVLAQLTYTNSNGQILITGYTGPVAAVTIPSTIDGLPVTGILSNAFINCINLTGIIIPNTVTNLGNSAFAGCTGLTSITIPKSFTGTGVFSGCTGLTNILLPNAIASIGDSEFSACTALTSITIPGSITNIGPWAFQNCYSLTAVYFQSNAPMADLTVFDGANNVTNYYLPKSAGWGTTFAGRPAVPVLFTCTTNSGAVTLTRYIGIWGSVVIPATLNGLPVTSIGNAAFYQNGSLTNIVIGTNVTSINGQAFVGCTNLLAISVDALNPVYSSVDGVLFDKSQATLLYFPGGRTGGYKVPNGVSNIATYAFQWCFNLTSVTIPASVTSLGGLAFDKCLNLRSVYFQGNAPGSDFTLFSEDNNVTVYYLPGTTGWGANLQGAPAVLWNPEAQTGDASFGVQNNQFGFNMTGSSNLVIVVEACTNPADPIWTALSTNTLTGGSAYFSDPQWTNYPSRMYRIRSP